MPKTLLLADDSITIQKVVGITFANEDFTVTSVDNGEDAVAKARELKPDVILADVVMPRKNGYELCEAVKGDPSLRHIPVLLLAGTFEAFDEARARSVKADGHISKPFESGALINKVKELVLGKGAAAAAPRPAGAPAPAPAAARPTAAPVPGAPRPGMPPPGAPRPAGAMPPGARPPGPGMAAGGARPPGPGVPPGPRPGVPSGVGRPPGTGMPPGGRPPGPGMPPGARPPGPGMPPAGARPPGAGMPAGVRPPTGTFLAPGARPAAVPPGAVPRPGAPGAPRIGAPMPAGGRPPGPGMPPPGARPGAVPAGPGAPLSSARPIPAPAPAARQTPAPAAPQPASGAKRDPFGFGIGAPGLPATTPQRSIEDDWSDVAATSPSDSARAPTPAPFAPALDLSLDSGPEERAPARPKEIDLPEEPKTEPELAPLHAFVPPAETTGHKPAPAAAASADGGEGALRDALSKASRDVIERVVWEVVPQLAETIIRENLDRLVKGRQG